MRSFYYIGCEDETAGKESAGGTGRRGLWKRRMPEPLPVCRCNRTLSFGKNSIQIYFSLLPAAFWEKKRKRERWPERIRQSVLLAEQRTGCRSYETLFAEKILQSGVLGEREERGQEILPELFGACLLERGNAPSGELEKISISLPPECGLIEAEKAVSVLQPFLKGINRVVLVGEETETARQLEDFFFGEYGILTDYSKKPEKNGSWLDLDGDSGIFLHHFASENGIYHLNRAEVLNFLDTMVKNEYNTGVN